MMLLTGFRLNIGDLFWFCADFNHFRVHRYRDVEIMHILRDICIYKMVSGLFSMDGLVPEIIFALQWVNKCLVP